MDPHRYPSRIDTWLVVLVAGALAFCVVHAAFLLPRSPAEALFVLGMVAFVGALLWAVGWPCVYTLGFALVSPRERDAFIAALTERAAAARRTAAGAPADSRAPLNH